jgi:hypothetical protein
MSWRRLGSPVRLSVVAAASSSRRDARSDSTASVMSTQGHRQDGQRPRADVAQEPGCGIGRGGHEDPVIGIAAAGAQMPVGRNVPVDLGHALRARVSCQGGEAAVGRDAEGRADLLRSRAVDDHGTGPGVDEVQPVHAVVCAQLARKLSTDSS